MGNFKEASNFQNKQNSPDRTNYAVGPQTPISGPTLQGNVSPKIEITITRQQLNAVARLFKDYGKPKPNWLRQRFYINQRRRKCLNIELRESQLDRVYCGHYKNNEDWDGLLHQLWHDINGEQPCFK